MGNQYESLGVDIGKEELLSYMQSQTILYLSLPFVFKTTKMDIPFLMINIHFDETKDCFFAKLLLDTDGKAVPKKISLKPALQVNVHITSEETSSIIHLPQKYFLLLYATLKPHIN